ncbi:hypothetical protein N7471_011146 [Penicillium samsonianum]|uniref:uncharacterized protein n=1 Tax=Penicillium samsonianum TaxID=1882272 RepID=UPI0025498084|nr:uncharacterized protein N7471_011146 [Penicillium samsonianum]KAJ6123829.1 hypothetical protein N7471_011146 [Penicillium samsonianum]
MNEDVINTPHVLRGTVQVTIEPQKLSHLSKNSHEKARFDFGADLLPGMDLNNDVDSHVGRPGTMCYGTLRLRCLMGGYGEMVVERAGEKKKRRRKEEEERREESFYTPNNTYLPKVGI